MGDRLTDGKDPKQTSLTPFGDTFDEALPHYLAMGMSWEEYWDGEYGTKKACRKAYQIRTENEQRLTDMNNWYLGQYVLAALSSARLFVAGFNTKGSHIPDYPSKPFLEKLAEEKREAVRKRKEEDQSKLAMALFQAMAMKMNRNIQKRLDSEKAEQTGQ